MVEGAQVLIVDDNEELGTLLSHLLKKEGFATRVVHDGETALEALRLQMPDLLICDIRMPGMDGMEVLRRAKELDPDLPVVLITAYAQVQDAVQAIKNGAFDYISKPFENHEVIRVAYRAMGNRDLKRKLRYLSHHAQEVGALREVMGPSDAIARLNGEVNRVAKSEFTVVILGETGSGKELVARAIHQASARSQAAFIPVDCGAIPETLLESELFGHEKGAFTGAVGQKSGKFEVARGGTLFLDEISNMPLGSQAKLLRVLQEKLIYRVGGNKPIQVEVRLLVASNQDLPTQAESGTFRQDLFYRMNEFTITVPPLRERKEDIPFLAKRFLDSANIELSKEVRGFSESALEALFGYKWPGNVRQFRATIRRAVLLADNLITEKHLDLKRVGVPGLAYTPKVQGMPWNHFSFKEILRQSAEALEREILQQALRHTGGNKAKAARLLRVDYKTIHTKVKKFRIPINGGGDGEEEG